MIGLKVGVEYIHVLYIDREVRSIKPERDQLSWVRREGGGQR